MFNLKLLWSLFGIQFTHFILGLSGGGGSEDSKFKEEKESTVDKEKISGSRQLTDKTTTGDQTRTSTDTQTQTGAVSSLDEETQGILSGLLSKLAAGGDSADLVSLLNERALNAEDTLGGLSEDIIAGARGNLETQLGQTIQGFARSAGSSQNTLVAQLGLEEGAKVEREIADLSATLGLSVNQAVTEQQEGAIGQTEDLVTQLADVLKGATQTQTGSVTRQLEELVASLQTEKGEATETEKVTESIEAFEKSKGKGKTSGASGGFSIGI